jgi:DNA-binding transcriptional LysR family regulator
MNPERGTARPADVFSVVDMEILLGISQGRTQAEMAARLRMEQPAISKRLRAAERRVGVPLVAQDGRRLALTPPGQQVAALAKDILSKYDGLGRLCASFQSSDRPHVRILTTPAPGSYVLPEHIASYMQLHRDIKVDIDVRLLDQVWDAFVSGNYDFAILPEMRFSMQMVSETLYEDSFVIFAVADHPLAQRESLSPDDLRGVTLTSKFSPDYWQGIFDGLARIGFSREQHVQILSYEAVKRTVKANRGVGMLYESSVSDELESGDFVRLPIKDRFLRQTFCLARRPDVVETRHAHDLRAFLFEHLGADREHSHRA